jgi:hypothetical protein
MGDSAQRWSTMLAQPFLFDGVTRDAGVLTGVRVESAHCGLRFAGTATHLRDPLITCGALDPFAVGVSREFTDAMHASTELAWRRWASGSGLGASAEVARRPAAGEWRVRATSAPGGSAVLARSQHDVTLGITRQDDARCEGTIDVRRTDVGFLRTGARAVSRFWCLVVMLVCAAPSSLAAQVACSTPDSDTRQTRTCTVPLTGTVQLHVQAELSLSRSATDIASGAVATDEIFRAAGDTGIVVVGPVFCVSASRGVSVTLVNTPRFSGRARKPASDVQLGGRRPLGSARACPRHRSARVR